MSTCSNLFQACKSHFFYSILVMIMFASSNILYHFFYNFLYFFLLKGFIFYALSMLVTALRIFSLFHEHLIVQTSSLYTISFGCNFICAETTAREEWWSIASLSTRVLTRKLAAHRGRPTAQEEALLLLPLLQPPRPALLGGRGGGYCGD